MPHCHYPKSSKRLAKKDSQRTLIHGAKASYARGSRIGVSLFHAALAVSKGLVLTRTLAQQRVTTKQEQPHYKGHWLF